MARVPAPLREPPAASARRALSTSQRSQSARGEHAAVAQTVAAPAGAAPGRRHGSTAARVGSLAAALGVLAAPLAAVAATAGVAAPASAVAPRPGASSPAAAAAAAAVWLTDDRNQRITLPAPPQRIVSLLPSLTELVCALDACGRLVGVDRYSSWPPSVRALPQLGGLNDTQIEHIVALRPDLVLVSGASRAIDRLESLGLRVAAVEPKTLRDTERAVQQLAALLGDAGAGAALWQRIEARSAVAAARVPAGWRGRSVYFEVASTPYAAGAGAFVGELLARLKLANVVPAALGPFPKLNPEFVVRAQPDVVMASARAITEMPSRPGWAALRALREHRACGFAPAVWDTLVRAGPRLAEAAEALADCLAALPAPPGRASAAAGAVAPATALAPAAALPGAGASSHEYMPMGAHAVAPRPATGPAPAPAPAPAPPPAPTSPPAPATTSARPGAAFGGARLPPALH